MLFLLLLSQLAWAFQPNDISILLPLPKKQEAQKLWGPQAGDVLLPLEVFQKLPSIVLDLDPRSLYERSLRVVAIRIDPCFRENEEKCRRQIRLAWQPLVFEEQEWSTLDASIHTFYDLTEAQWESLKKELPRGAAGEKPGVHPVMAREGYGAHWEKLQVILRYCNPVTLTRATAMTVNALGNIWFFTGVDLHNKTIYPIQIPRVNDSTQGFFANVNHLDSPDFRVAMNPAPHEAEPFLKLLRDSAGAKDWVPAEVQAATREALRLENPRRSHSGSVDCASCHSARLVTSWAARNFPDWRWRNLFEEDLFIDEGKVFSPEARTVKANVLRMFGYFGAESVVDRRVELETIDSLKQM